MNTAGDNIPTVKKPFDYYEAILEDFEFYFPKWQLQKITDLHNGGKHIDDISRTVKRKPMEIFLAILHQAEKGEITRPIAFWNRSEPHEQRQPS